MPLSPGARFGPYEIIEPLGAGGMGEVYRARDTTLHRDAAIKILPPLFARDPERLARFGREARTLAALNHPNIAQVYGMVELPDHAGSHGLVMEFVDGEDLAQRLARTGAVPLDEAVPIALQIAQGLEAAHEQGIIHRDLKPANIKMRGDGQVKVLDFGLAKALAPFDPAAPAPQLENSPTITSPFQLSQLGVVLGTAAYMAPEQAKGKPIDKRADVWAFGCVLYEMLTGARAFAGEDVTDTLAAIVRADPDWSALPADTPPHVRTLLRRCLEKDRRERLPDIGAARLELKEAGVAARNAAAVAPGALAPRRTAIVPWALCAIASAAAIAAVSYAWSSRPAPDTRVYKSFITPPAPLSGAPALRLSISPDGTRLAFVAPDQSGRMLIWVRPLNSLSAQPLAGTTGAVSPFWSPDGRWIGFIADGKLKKIEATGGAVLTLCPATGAPPPAWNRDGIILFSGQAGGLDQVREAGGATTPVTNPAGAAASRHIAPSFLPDGRHFLFAASAAGSATPGIYVGSLDSKEVTRLLSGSSNPAYASGHLLYLRDTTLVAQPFDPETRTFSGEPLPVAEGLQVNPATGTGAYAVSQTGVLVYQTGDAAGTQLAWFDRTGKIVGPLGEPGSYRDVELSPDGRFASFTLVTAGRSDVWIHDVDRDLRRRFTFADDGHAAVWSPDGRRLAFARTRASGFDLYMKPAGGSDTEHVLLNDGRPNVPVAFTPDGRGLIFSVLPGTLVGELWMLPLDPAGPPRRLTTRATRETSAAVSPNGRWIAYAAEQNNVQTVFVTSFPDAAGRWQISPDGGGRPRWSRDGKQLFFMGADHLAVADVDTTGAQFDLGAVRRLFDVRVPAPTLGTRSPYAVSPDAQRFLFNTWDARGTQTPLTLVVNWPAALAR